MSHHILTLTLNTVFNRSSKSSFSLRPFTPSWRRDAQTLYKSERRSPVTVWLTELCVVHQCPFTSCDKAFLYGTFKSQSRKVQLGSFKQAQPQTEIHACRSDACTCRRAGNALCASATTTPLYRLYVIYEGAPNTFFPESFPQTFFCTWILWSSVSWQAVGLPVRDRRSCFLGLLRKWFKNTQRVKQVRLSQLPFHFLHY